MADIQNALEYKGGTNGLKTILGAALIVAAGQLNILKDLLAVYPANHSLEIASNYLNIIIFYLQKALNYGGSGLMLIGFLDKIKKLFGK